MRKIILLASLVLGSIPVFSQITTLSDAELGFGLETAVPLKGLNQTQKTGLGGSIKFGYTLPNTYYLAPTFQAGFISFSGKEIPGDQTNLLKETYTPVFMVPVKVGLRYTFAGGIYGEPQVGATMSMSETDMGQSKNSFGLTYAFNLGFQTLPGLDISARYESVKYLNGDAAMAGLRIAYHFTFRRQEIY